MPVAEPAAAAGGLPPDGVDMATSAAAEVEQGESPIQEEHYVLHGGLRQIVPYFFDFKCTVKPRFEGMLVTEFMAEEFPSLPRSYYEAAVSDGRVRVEAQAPPARLGSTGRRPRLLDPHAPLQHNAVVRHLLHRHEPPALALGVPLLGEAGDLFAVGKPPGLPVHAAGGYRKATVCGVLEAAARAAATAAGTPPPPPPYPVHRLDRPVSGVLLLARSARGAERVAGQIARREVEKVYVARVVGVFPEGPLTLDAALAWDSQEHVAHVLSGKPKWRGGSGGDGCGGAGAGRGAPKPAATTFVRLAVAPDGRTSVVECRPLTGRTHQIRAHLGHLGHPIANDALYGGTFPGPERPRLAAHGGATGAGRGGAGVAGGDEDEERTAAGAVPAWVAAAAAECAWACSDGIASGGLLAGDAAPTGGSPASPAPTPLPPDSLCAAALGACPFCPGLARPFRRRDLLPLWLHARSYAGPGWAFACPPPAWAAADFVPRGAEEG